MHEIPEKYIERVRPVTSVLWFASEMMQVGIMLNCAIEMADCPQHDRQYVIS